MPVYYITDILYIWCSVAPVVLQTSRGQYQDAILFDKTSSPFCGQATDHATAQESSVAFREVGLELDPSRIVVSEATMTNEVRYRGRAQFTRHHRSLY